MAESTSDERVAPWFAISKNDVMSVEHPCIVRNRSKAVATLGGASQIAQSLEKGTDECLSLNFEPDNSSSRTILSLHNDTDNVLLKITVPRRTNRKRKRGSHLDFANDPNNTEPNRDVKTLLDSLTRNRNRCRVDAIANIKSSHVWRSIPDFAYFTTPSKFLQSIEQQILPQQYPKLKQWSMPRTYGLEDTETIPPPVFSTQSLAQNYTYRQNPAVKLIADPVTGNKVLRNTSTPTKLNVQSCMYDDTVYPDKPIPGSPPLSEQPEHVQTLVAEMSELFEERPIWTRRALINRLPLNSPTQFVKNAAGYLAFNLRSGPWRDTYCVFGVDPRTDPKYRKFQTILIKLVSKDKTSLASRKGIQRIWTRSPDNESHIFTGTKDIPPDGKVWQLCDMQDPQLKQLIDVPNLNLRAQCETRYFGWYENGTNAKIRVLLKAKVDALNEGQSLEKDVTEKFLILPDKWNPGIKSVGGKAFDPTSGYLPENSSGQELEWAAAYRSICRTSTGDLPNYGSMGKGRLSKRKPTARPSYIDAEDGMETFQSAPDEEADVQADDDDDAQHEAEADARVATAYEEPDVGDDDDEEEEEEEDQQEEVQEEATFDPSEDGENDL